jgi:hypothetical protein
MGFLFVAYDPQGYGGGIRLLLHTRSGLPDPPRIM